MKSFTRKIIIPVAFVALLAFCEKNKDAEPNSPLEYNFIRSLSFS